MQCPKCKSILGETPVSVYSNGGTVRIIGQQKFCLNRDCNWEGKIEK